MYAFAWELEAWRESRRQLVEAEAPEPASSPSANRRVRWWLPAGALTLVAVAAAAWFLFGRASAPADQHDPEAVRLVTLASFGGNAGRTQVETGIRYLQDAIRIDPRYASAWANLATAHLVRIWFGEVKPDEALPQVYKEIEEAMRLDPSLGESWRVRAAASHFFEWEHARAESEFRRAIELGPDDPAAFSWYADYLLDLRRFDDARVCLPARPRGRSAVARTAGVRRQLTLLCRQP